MYPICMDLGSALAYSCGMIFKPVATLLLCSAALLAQPEVLITGLRAPNKLLLTPQGNFLVTETSMAINDGRISFVSRAGVRRSLIEGMPSGTEVTLTGGSGPSAMALRGRTLYVTIGAGDGERRGATPGTSIHNPAGVSSPLFASILEIRFSTDIDVISGTFPLTPEIQQRMADGRTVEVSDGSGSTAQFSLLTKFPVSEADRIAVYRFSNPWSLAFTPDGSGLYAGDASMNAINRIDLATGRWQRLLRFAPVPNPTPVGAPMLDAVPTSVRVYGDKLLVSLLTGFPFVPGNSRVMLADPEAGTSQQFMFDLTSATDVLWRPRGNARAQFFVLEFSMNQSASAPPPGRLLQFDNEESRVAAAPLITPVSMALDDAAGELFILELRGQILRLKLNN
jgi:hypothetical protein